MADDISGWEDSPEFGCFLKGILVFSSVLDFNSSILLIIYCLMTATWNIGTMHYTIHMWKDIQDEGNDQKFMNLESMI